MKTFHGVWLSTYTFGNKTRTILKINSIVRKLINKLRKPYWIPRYWRKINICMKMSGKLTNLKKNTLNYIRN